MEFTQLRADPVQGAEIARLLGLAPHDFDNPTRSGQIKEVLDYFASRKEARSEILRVLTGKPYVDKLEVIWAYVALKKEKEAKLAELDPEDFEKDIDEEIVGGHVTKASKKRVKTDAEIQMAELKKKRDAEADDRELVDRKMNKIEKTLSTLEEIEQIDQELLIYG